LLFCFRLKAVKSTGKQPGLQRKEFPPALVSTVLVAG